MNIVVHSPKRPEDVNELQREVGLIHADAVLRYVQNLSCPKEQKLKLLDEIKKACRENR
jgi:uncharacterized protein YdcH (DUF465 family)